MIDGYSRFQAFMKVVLPQAGTGIAATLDFLFDIRVERICLRLAADIRRGADRAALHTADNRRGRP